MHMHMSMYPSTLALDVNGSTCMISYDPAASVGDVLDHLDPSYLLGSTGESKIMHGERELDKSKSWVENAVPIGAKVVVKRTYLIVAVPKPPKVVVDGMVKDAAYIDKSFGAGAHAAKVCAIRKNGKWRVSLPMVRKTAFIGLGKAKSAMKVYRAKLKRRAGESSSRAKAASAGSRFACRKCGTPGAKDGAAGKCIRGKPDCPARESTSNGKRKLPASPGTPPATPPMSPARTPVTEWVQHTSSRTGQPYMYNKKTGEALWLDVFWLDVFKRKRPASPGTPPATPPMSLARTPVTEWVQHTSSRTGQPYMYNKKTGEALWLDIFNNTFGSPSSEERV